MHAGQLQILRELIDGRSGSDRDDVGDERWWANCLGGSRLWRNGSGPSQIDPSGSERWHSQGVRPADQGVVVCRPHSGHEAWSGR